MNKTPLFLLVTLSLIALAGTPEPASAHYGTASASRPESAAPVNQQAPAATPGDEADNTDQAGTATPAPDGQDGHDGHDGHDNSRVVIGADAKLQSGEHASAVVSVFGSASSAGEVDDAVVSILGDTRVTGPVGDAAVAVLGNTYVDSRVSGEAVAVFGNVELGPHADVGGNVVAVGGEVRRDPAAIVHGTVQDISLFGAASSHLWLRSWVQHCLLLGRPLALAPGLGWAWTLALSFLGLYLLIALLFPAGVEQCVSTMEQQPGRCLIASLITWLAKPFVLLLILITVIGAVVLPFLMMALFAAGLFGKAVLLAWVGRRVVPRTATRGAAPPVLAVLVGGAIVLALYLVPIVGFIVYKGTDVLGLGIVVYTLIVRSRATHAGAGPAPVPGATLGTPTPDTPAAPAAPSAGGPDGTAGTAGGAQFAASAAASAGTGVPPPGPTAAQATPAPAPAPAPVPLSASAERAGFWIRMAAMLLDLLIVAVVISLLPGRLDDVFSHGFLVWLAVYGAVLWKVRGTTVGGSVCHLQLVRLDGRAIDWPTAIVRAVSCFLSMAVAGLGFIWVAIDPERQSWHDKIAGTVVVRTPRGRSLV